MYLLRSFLTRIDWLLFISNSKRQSPYRIFKSLFNICFDYWVSGLNDPLNLNYVSLTRHGLRRDITIDSNSIRIGCQTVRRYEFEQIAIQLGFRGEKFTNVRKLKYKS